MKTSVLILVICVSFSSAAPPFVQTFHRGSDGTLKCQNGDKVFKGDTVVWEKGVQNITCPAGATTCGLMSLAFTWTEDDNTQHLTQAIGFCATEAVLKTVCDEAKKGMPEQGKIQVCKVKSCNKDLCNTLVPSLPGSEYPSLSAMKKEKSDESNEKRSEGTLKCQNGDKVYNKDGTVAWQKDVKNITCPSYADTCGLMSMAFTYTENGNTYQLTQAYGMCTTEDYLNKHNLCEMAKKEMPDTTKIQKCNVKSCNKDLCNDLVPSLLPNLPNSEDLGLILADPQDS